jgi:hypothetical protein
MNAMLAKQLELLHVEVPHGRAQGVLSWESDAREAALHLDLAKWCR